MGETSIHLIFTGAELIAILGIIFALGRYAEKISELSKKIEDCEKNKVSNIKAETEILNLKYLLEKFYSFQSGNFKGNDGESHNRRE